MADDASPKSEPEIVAPPTAPPSREPRHDPGVIEGEATEIRELRRRSRRPPKRRSMSPRTCKPPTRSPRPSSRPPPRLAARRARSVSPSSPGRSALSSARRSRSARHGSSIRAPPSSTRRLRVWPRSNAATKPSCRPMPISTSASARWRGARRGAAKAAVEALGRRIAALESAAGKDEAAQTALAEARAARADADKALALATAAGQTAPAPTQSGAPVPFDASALQARLGAVESDLAALKSREADLGALDQRVAKIESALAAPKSEARIAAAEVAVSRGGAAEAILAISLNERLNAGAPFEQEWAALTRLGADGRQIGRAETLRRCGRPDGCRARRILRQDRAQRRRGGRPAGRRRRDGSAIRPHEQTGARAQSG